MFGGGRWKMAFNLARASRLLSRNGSIGNVRQEMKGATFAKERRQNSAG